MVYFLSLASVAAQVVSSVLRSHSRRGHAPSQDSSTDTEDSDDSGDERLHKEGMVSGGRVTQAEDKFSK